MEERYLLSASPSHPSSIDDGWTIRTSPAWDPLLHPQAQAAASEYLAEGAAVAPFNLHSKPDAEKIIYLDFDGQNVSDTTWNLGNPDFVDEETMEPLYPVPTIFALNFSIDDDLSFSNTELQVIQRIWERVSEDFSPFNVDVTTEMPEEDVVDNGVRVVISGSSNDWWIPPGEGAIGGVAYVGSFTSTVDNVCWVFPENLGAPGNPATIEKNVAEAASHEVGHTLGLHHDGEKMPFTDPVEYYAGHGAGATGWAPIMGVGYDKELVQWSKAEYPWAFNGADDEGVPLPLEDDLEIITTMNGFDYRDDDHGDTIAEASWLEFTRTSFFGDGIIERNDDVDFFEISISVEAVVINIDPFHLGPNLDILATLYNAAGEEIASSNPIDALNATFSINTEGGLLLPAGSYFLAIDGTGKPETTDYGYSDYGSLGQYTISATRESFLANLIGVDFDVTSGQVPTNWRRYSGTTSPNPNPLKAILSELKDELGTTTATDLRISSNKTTIPAVASALDAQTVPVHPAPLDELGGFLRDTNVQWTFEWTDLDPLSVYEFYVFGAHNTGGANQVKVEGHDDTIEFMQSLSANELMINTELGDDHQQLINYSNTIRSTAAGTIKITVSSPAGMAAGVAALAIRPAIDGSIHGQKWNDLNGDGIKDLGEPGLEGWTIFLDENNNGQLDNNFTQNTPSVDVPQPIPDANPGLSTIKSELFFQGISDISDVNVTIDITHEHAGDLNVYLISPTGTRVELVTDVGGISDLGFRNTTFDDEASTWINSGTGSYTGSFRPESFVLQNPASGLGAFDGEDPNGLWTLEVSDDASLHVGTLHSWSLSIVGREHFTVTDGSGNYSFEDVPAGIYDVQEVLTGQPGWIQRFAPPPVRVTSGARVLDVDFGNWVPIPVPSSIAGQKWNDLNGDGIKDPGELGLEGWTIYVDENDNGVFDPAITETLASTATPQNILDLSTVISPIEVGGFGAVVNLEVTVNISHTFAADLDVFLISPSGRQVALFTNVGGQFNNFQNTTLSDNATVPIFSGTAPFAGSYLPEGLLSDFIGEEANGIWQLLIRDTNFGDVGTLNSWTLKLVRSERSTVTDADGNYIFPEMEPGTYIVREVLRPGWVQTAPIFTTGNDYWEIEIGESTVVTDAHFGNQETGFLIGDYDADGIVGSSDYIVWRFTMGDTVAPFSGADGDGSGVIDQADYNLWRANFGASLSSGAGGAAIMAVSAAGESQPGLVSATAVEQPESEPYVVASSAVIVAEQGSSKAATLPDARAESTSLTISRSSPPLRGKFTPASQAIESASSDAAILAWLSSSTRDDRRASSDDIGIASDWDSTDSDHSELCDSVDVAFESIGAA